jgi:hypothetical protein
VRACNKHYHLMIVDDVMSLATSHVFPCVMPVTS